MAERYKRLFYDKKEIHTIDSPVSVVGRALLWDNVTEKEISQIKLKNLFANSIKAVSVLIKTYDTAGDFMGDIQYEYKDLLVNQYETFGDQIAIGVENDSVRLFDVYISRVVYGNGEVWKSQVEENYEIEDEVPLERFLGDTTLVEQYRLKYGTTARMVPRFYNDIWICTCGNVNRVGVSDCTNCGKSKVKMLEDLDKDTLIEEYRASQYEKAVDLYQKGGEQNCNEACRILQKLQGYKDAEDIYVQCVDAENRERVWREYNECIEIVSNGDISSLEQAIGYLERLGDYQDAKSYAKQGTERIKRLRAEEEENKKTRELEEKKNKKRKTAYRFISAIATISIIAIIAACIYLHKEKVRIQEMEAKELHIAEAIEEIEKLAEEENFEEAMDILDDVPEVKERKPELQKFISAGVSFQQGKYVEAKTTFEEMGEYLNADYYEILCRYKLLEENISKDNISECRKELNILLESGAEDIDNLDYTVFEVEFEQAYQLADEYKMASYLFREFQKRNATMTDIFVKENQEKWYNDATMLLDDIVENKWITDSTLLPVERLFEMCNKDYRDITVYSDILNLIGRTGEIDERMFQYIKEYEVAEKLLWRDYYSWFEGSWVTNNKKYYFEYTSSRFSYNLPFFDHTNGYMAIDCNGICYVYDENDESENRDSRQNLFDFDLVTENQIKVYCYKNGQTYMLYRK